MKKIFLTILIVMFAISIYAGISHLSEERTGAAEKMIFGTVCIDGYKFAYATKVWDDSGVALVQMYESRFTTAKWLTKCKGGR